MYKYYALYSFDDGRGREVEAMNLVRAHLHNKYHPDAEVIDPDDADLIITFGGDGTLLGALRRYTAPILSLNTGTKGFLTAVRDPALFINAVDAAFAGKLLEMPVVTMRMTQSGSNFANYYAVDEILLQTTMTWMTVRIETLNLETGVNTFVRDMRCAGMYIGAPLGATSPMGVSFQCPVMDPDLRTFYIKGTNDALKPSNGGLMLNGYGKRLHLTITDIGVNNSIPEIDRRPPAVFIDSLHTTTLAIGDTLDIEYFPPQTLLRLPDQPHWAQVYPG